MADNNEVNPARIPALLDSTSPVEPSKIPELIAQAVKRAIDTAAIVSDDDELLGNHNRDNFLDTQSGGLLIFKLPEDAHLMPLVEREMFRQFTAINEQGGSLSVPSLLLAPLDPEIAQIMEMYHPGEYSPESTLEYELRHANALEPSHKPVQIGYKLGRKSIGDGKYELMFCGAIMEYETDENNAPDVNSILGPKYLSSGDISDATNDMIQIYKSSTKETKDHNGNQLDKLLDYLDTISMSADIDDLVTSAWEDYRLRGKNMLKLIESCRD